MNSERPLRRVSVVIPVYRGQSTLPRVIQELEQFTHEQKTPKGVGFVVSEVILIHDCGPDNSDAVIEELSAAHTFVKPVWLTRNYGQHSATLAGMASATGDYVATMDEDGQQDPAFIGAMLDIAERGYQIVYGKPTNPPPHGMFRNVASRTAKRIAAFLLGNRSVTMFNSFRLVEGGIARSLAAYCGSGVFLDVALFWITSGAAQCPVTLRREMGRPSGYSFIRLVRHFWQLILTSGTKPLRLITVLGFGSLVLACCITVYALYAKFALKIPVQGWASIVIVVAFFSGCILMSLGVIAEYLAVTMSIVMGKPLYLVSHKPTRHPNQ